MQSFINICRYLVKSYENCNVIKILTTRFSPDKLIAII